MAKDGPAVQQKEPLLITPVPPDNLSVSLITVDAGERLHRIHLDKYRATQFNPGVEGNARFSPIKDEKARAIPTLYAGSNFSCALMETLFHDVPHTSGFKSLAKGKFTGQNYSVIEVKEKLLLADLRGLALRKLGIKRSQLIDTEKNHYPDTRKWAEAIHSQCRDVQGLLWVSRQDDTARAVMIFGDRVRADALQPVGDSLSLLQDAGTWEQVLDLAGKIALSIVPSLH
ncbi:RES family NAD+ phosphorylase [Erwinia sp. CGal63]|uniref:RES family NAD+ phosphorylase n=1 Tax=Erwinia sp. CGal63 TaxID=2919889 RepID=UPI00300A7D72